MIQPWERILWSIGAGLAIGHILSSLVVIIVGGIISDLRRKAGVRPTTKES